VEAKNGKKTESPKRQRPRPTRQSPWVVEGPGRGELDSPDSPDSLTHAWHNTKTKAKPKKYWAGNGAGEANMNRPRWTFN